MPNADTTTVDTGLAVGPQLTRILRERIVRNLIAPGERLSEAEVALHYGTSRQPVREAFIKLAEEGLLEVRPQRGTYVRKISTANVMDARFIREAVEADVARALAADPDPALVRELEAQLAAQRALVDPTEFRQLDDLFHRTLAEGAKLPYVWRVIDGLKTQMDRVRQLSTEQLALGKLIDHHTAIVDAIRGGDAEAAGQAMRLHLREILNDLPIIRQARPDLFEDPGR
ncbi:GntR family transcriptional regulator [Falsirhodobacter algicola]|uniref:FCD domain-containing protein n=1 Tax=Falsirhodobacter algicola TaxID=2692330 RepID=A0A8J8MT60_9RHOB|nr:GntR family transcriptional regulator [Falsirhodobacter algicola]QUS36227.1 FCD domain-containing protein [Falsirhodobacter algicola]